MNWIKFYLSISFIAIAAIILKYVGFIYFHCFIELLTVLISAVIFYKVFYNNNKNNTFLVIVACGCISVGLQDLFHTLTYKGMNIFNISDSNTATQFWVSARITETITYTASIFLAQKKLKFWMPLLFFVSLAVIFSILIFSGNFPAALVEYKGLTHFKIYAEYIIIGVLIFCLLNIYRLMENFTYEEYIILISAIAFKILSEFVFTLYSDVYGTTNTIGHILKAISFILIAALFINFFKNKQYTDN